MDTTIAAVITAVAGIIGGYFIGNRRLKFEHLHERRAEVIAELCERLAAVQRSVVSFTNFIQSADVDRSEQAQDANRAFAELVDYYRANEVWLTPETCKQIEAFLDNVYLSVGEYADHLDERGYPNTAEGRALGNRIMREVQPLRRELIAEFREIMYPPPWYEAPRRALALLPPRNREDSS